MEMFQEAYERYTSTCKRYGMESVNMYQFLTSLTEEQLEELMTLDN